MQALSKHTFVQPTPMSDNIVEPQSPASRNWGDSYDRVGAVAVGQLVSLVAQFEELTSGWLSLECQEWPSPQRISPEVAHSRAHR
jgi:hypothetical protein